MRLMLALLISTMSSQGRAKALSNLKEHPLQWGTLAPLKECTSSLLRKAVQGVGSELHQTLASQSWGKMAISHATTLTKIAFLIFNTPTSITCICSSQLGLTISSRRSCLERIRIPLSLKEAYSSQATLSHLRWAHQASFSSDSQMAAWEDGTCNKTISTIYQHTVEPILEWFIFRSLKTSCSLAIDKVECRLERLRTIPWSSPKLRSTARLKLT